jgi:integrase
MVGPELPKLKTWVRFPSPAPQFRKCLMCLRFLWSSPAIRRSATKVGTSVSSAQYLYRRPSGIYFVRLCVPARLKSAVGKGEVHRSTGCRDFRLAKIVAAELAAHWHKAIDCLKSMDVAKIRSGSLELLGGGFIGLTEAAAAVGAEPAQLARRLADRDAYFYVLASSWKGWAVSDIHSDLEHERDELGQVSVVLNAERLGGQAAQIAFSGRLRIRFTDEALDASGAAETGICQFLVWPSRERGFIVDIPGQQVSAEMLEVSKVDVENLRSSLAQEIGAAHLTAFDPAAAAFDVVQKPKTRFSDLRKEYLARNKAFWKPDQLERRIDQCRAFEELMGDLPLDEISRAVMRKFSDEIARLPANRQLVKRRFDRPSASFPELVSLAELHGLPRLTVGSQHRLLDGLAEVFTWAERETLISANPAKGLGAEATKASGTLRVKQHEQREAFSQEDLGKIFSAAWFTSGTGARTAKGVFYAYRPHYYWLPLLGLFTGGRLNELSQLYLKDIAEVEGVLCIDFNLLGEGKLDVDVPDPLPASDKSLKTVNSRRVIPVHAQLQACGFLAYVEALRKAGHNRLFPELAFDSRKGYGKAAGKWFNERYLGKELEIPRNGRKTFHSFRHNFATALGMLSAKTTVKSDLMGHARGEALVEVRYDKGAALRALQTVINEINHLLPVIAQFSVKEGVLAVSDALSLKARHAHHRTPILATGATATKLVIKKP